MEFKKYESEIFKSNTAVLNLDDVKIEFMADPKKKFDTGEWVGLPKEDLHKIEYAGYCGSILSL